MNSFHPNQLVRRDTDRIERYRELLNFYHGEQWVGRERRGEKRLTFNYARTFVEKVASYLMSGITFAVDPREDSSKERENCSRAEAALHRVYDENNLEQLDLETEIDCAILGDSAYKVIWDAASQTVRVTAPDIQGIFTWTAPDDVSRVWRVASRYALSSDTASALYATPAKGRSLAVVEAWTDSEFQLWVDDSLIESKANPYGFIPFVIFPNLREPKKAWGASDLVQIRETQCELNRAMSQLSRILELSGNPIAVLENVEQSEDISVNPGAVWNVPEDAKAYLLDLLQGGGVRLHIDYINMLYRILHDLSESPRAAFGRADGGADGGAGRDLSGLALEMELQPLLQKVRRKRLIRTVAYNPRNAMVLKLLERYEGVSFGDNHLRVVWGQVLPGDISKTVADEQVLVQNGIHSRRRAMDELGIQDPEAEFKRWLEEKAEILRVEGPSLRRAQGEL